MKTFLVGGAVRDQLLGLPVKDRDFVVVGATEAKMLSSGFQKVGGDFPVFLHPNTKEEYALARREKKISAGYKGFSVDFSPDVTLEEDLARRDLTINAIAYDGENYIDPFGGMSDLKDKTLRPVGDSFKEDPVRILRLARFKCRFSDFTLNPSAYTIASEMTQELKALKPERVRLELEKAFEEKTPSLFFETLLDLRVLEQIFPSIHALINVPQVEKYYPEGDCFVHTMLVLNHARHQTSDLTCLYAALLHDLGKALTPKDILPRHIGHEHRGVSVVSAFLDKYAIHKQESFILAFVKHHLNIHRALELSPKKLIDLLQAFRIKKSSDEALKNLIICAKSDAYGKGTETPPYPQADFLREVVKVLENLDLDALTKDVLPHKRKDIVLMHKIESLKRLCKNSEHKL